MKTKAIPGYEDYLISRAIRNIDHKKSWGWL